MVRRHMQSELSLEAEPAQVPATTTDPRVEAAYNLKQEIDKKRDALKAAEAEITEMEEELRGLLADIGNYKDAAYVVSNLKRANRVIDMDLLRANLPDIARAAKPTDNWIMKQLSIIMGIEALRRIVEENNPEEYAKNCKMSVTEFDKLTGDSSTKRQYTGIAYHEKWVQDEKNPLSITYIGQHRALHAPSRYGKEEEGEDDE